MEIGDKVKLKTKKGIVEKYLSYVCHKTKTYYFVEKVEDIKNLRNVQNGWLYGPKGTAHSFKNIIWE